MLRRALKTAALVPAALTAAGVVVGYLIASRRQIQEEVTRPAPDEGGAAAPPKGRKTRRPPVQEYVRTAGPDEMASPPREGWNEVDEASDESFPASDPPARY